MTYTHKHAHNVNEDFKRKIAIVKFWFIKIRKQIKNCRTFSQCSKVSRIHCISTVIFRKKNNRIGSLKLKATADEWYEWTELETETIHEHVGNIIVTKIIAIIEIYLSINVFLLLRILRNFVVEKMIKLVIYVFGKRNLI